MRRKPPPVSRRVSRRGRGAESNFTVAEPAIDVLPAKDKWWQHLHNWLSLLVAAFAAAAAIGSLRVGSKQADLMDLARQDAIESAKEDASLAREASLIAGREAQASTDQAASLSKQLRVITDQLEISRNQAVSNGAQARSMENLAAASRSQALSQAAQLKRMDRMALAAESQLNVQLNTNYEARKAQFILEFNNMEMNSLDKFNYDPAISYNINFSFQNVGKNSALTVSRIETFLLKPGEAASYSRCKNLKCQGSNPILITGGSVGTSSISLVRADVPLESLEKEDYALIVFLVVDWRDVATGIEDHQSHCKMYQFSQKRWNACPQTI